MIKNLYKNISEMETSGYDEQTIEESKRWNQQIGAFLASSIGEHLRTIDELSDSDESGGCILNTESIHDEIQLGVGPCGYIFPFGYIPIWRSVGGNAVVFCLADGYFYWADHISFSGEEITVPVTYEDVPFTKENIPRALILLSKDSPTKFLSDLRSGIYEAKLDELD